MKIKKILLYMIITLVAILATCTAAYAAESQAKVDSSTYNHPGKFDDCIIIDGIDVSYWQSSMDWNKIKRQGIDYAIIRIGYTSTSSTFSRNSDSTFASKIAAAKAAGLQVGVYYYSQATSATEAQKEANWVVDALDGYSIDLPVVMDYEFYSGGRLNNAYYSWTSSNRKAKMTTNALAFLKVIKDAGYEPMFYSYRSMMDPSFSSKACFNMSLIENLYKVWIANYGTSNSYSGDYQFWQYTSSGTATGYSGRLDCNFWYFNNDAEVTKSDTTSIKNCNISLGKTSYTYTKFKKTPTVTVTKDGSALTKGTDYTVSYVKNVFAGNGYAMVRGIGNYSNTALVPFTISKANISGAVVSNISDKVYSGSAKKPSVTVSFTGTTLKSADYTVSYSNNVDVGTATVTITGRRNFTGSIKKTFQITKATPSFTGYSSYSRTTTSGAFTLNTKCTSNAKLTYASSDAQIATVSSSGKVTLKGKVGTVKITVTSNATDDFKAATKTITITVKKATPTMSGTSTYSKVPSSLSFALSVKSSSGTKLSYKSSDTAVAVVNAEGQVTVKNPGKATITVTSAANDIYSTGTYKITVKVRPYKQVITLSSPSAGKLRVTLTANSSKKSGFEVKYSRNKDFSGYIYSKTITDGAAKYRTYTGTSGKTYYVKVRAYITAKDGTKVYGLYSNVGSIKLK